MKTKRNRRQRKQRRRNRGKTSICYTNKTEPCMHCVKNEKLFFFFFTETLLNAWKKPRRIRCTSADRAGASVADQIDFYLEVTKKRHFLVIRERVRSGRLGMYISQYIYIAYVYLYICIYVYAIDTCKENERKGSWYVDEAFFFFFLNSSFHTLH